MKQGLFTIVSNTALTPIVYKMWLQLSESLSLGIRAGQFVNIRLAEQYLRRPISVCDAVENRLCIVFKVVGDGTRKLSQMQAGETLDILYDLGNGYDLSKAGSQPLLIGGGIGVPPLYYLAKCLRAQGKAVHVVLGFNTAAEVILEDDFQELGCTIETFTMDGSYGKKGLVTDSAWFKMQVSEKQCNSDILVSPNSQLRTPNSELPTYFYTCGPIPMLRAIYNQTTLDGEFSLEERMGCGFGACMGCTCETKHGHKRVCKEGPVFAKSDLLWN